MTASAPGEGGSARARWLGGKGAGLILDVAVNVAAPLLIYDAMRPMHGDMVALLYSCLPPLLWSLAGFLRNRRIDALSVLALVGIALSLLAMGGGGSVRLLQLREKMVTLLIALAFLGSAAIGKPLIWPLARATMRRESAEAAAAFEARSGETEVRRTVMVMTIVWGVGLLLDFLVSALLIYSLTIAQYLLVGPLLGYLAIGALSLWTLLYRRHCTRKLTKPATDTSVGGQRR